MARISTTLYSALNNALYSALECAQIYSAKQGTIKCRLSNALCTALYIALYNTPHVSLCVTLFNISIYILLNSALCYYNPNYKSK